MRRKKNREINVFSTSAIDLFASAMGVFILLMIVTIPYYTNTSQTPSVDMVEKAELDRLEAKLKTLSKSFEQVHAEKTKLEQDVRDLKAKLAVEKPKPERPVEDIMRPLQDELKKIQVENEVLKRKIKEIGEIRKEARSIVELDAEVEDLQKKLKELQDLIKTLKLEVEDEKKKVLLQAETITRKDEEIKKIKEELERVRAANKTSFLVVIVKWTTNKHDLDLQVVTPDKARYNFKNKKYARKSGLFSLDSRTGPGAEIFQTPEALVGDYEVVYEFYNNYGNTEPLKAQGTVLTSKGTFDLPPVTMEFEKSRKQLFRFRLNDNGEVVMIQ